VYARSVSLGSQAEATKCLQTLFPLLIQDTLWLTTMVALTLDLRQKRASSSHAMTLASMEYRGRSIDELRRRLVKSEECSSFGTLLAVGMLITISILQCDTEATRSHVDGLRHLVSMRGGQKSFQASDEYLRDRIFGYFVMWDLTQAGQKLDPGSTEYPKHPYSTYLCRVISRLPPGLADVALSGTLNCAVIRLLAALAFCFSKILADSDRQPLEMRRMLVLVYALSRQACITKLGPIEQLVVVAVIEVCISLGSKRSLHWLLISAQQSCVMSSASQLELRDLRLALGRFSGLLVWIGAVLVVTSKRDSESWTLGKQLMEQGHDDDDVNMDDIIPLCKRYLWQDELTVRLTDYLKEEAARGKV
jgi:hypothetical protein